MENNNKKIYIKEDLILDYLKDFNFKYSKKDNGKEVYSGNGMEIDVKTREVKSISKVDLLIYITLYKNNIFDIK